MMSGNKTGLESSAEKKAGTRKLFYVAIGLLLAGLLLPLAPAAGFLIGLLMGVGALPASAESVAVIIELLLVFGGLLGAVLFALVTKPKETEV
jgi:hypothetical protein